MIGPPLETWPKRAGRFCIASQQDLDLVQILTSLPHVSSSSADLKPKPALRWVAVFCALTVWMLGLLAVSPELHAALHADANHTDHACAVTLFNQGVEGTNPSIDFAIAPLVLLADSPVSVETRPAAAPRYWLQPGRAPPGC
jgi:hypothetical protein